MRHPCALVKDFSIEDPFSVNESVEAVYQHFWAWKVRVGVKIEDAGHVRFEHMYIADAREAAFVVLRAEDSK